MSTRSPSLAYAGIGSRKTPDGVLQLMQRIAKRLAGRGYTLRSGAAEGADAAFEAGAEAKEIYLPWRGFNQHPSQLFDLPNRAAAAAIASKHHPAWSRLSQGAIKLHTRNVYQVLGQGLDLAADFVLCWTPDGAESSAQRSAKTGGTGMAIEIAEAYGVPIFNLARLGALDRLAAHLASLQPSTEPL